MSGADSSLLKQCQAQFSEWGVDHVKWCLRAARQYVRPRQLGEAQNINRATFFELFGLVPPEEHDYRGKFLSLPIWVFNLFDFDDKGVASVLHILAALCMFGSGNLRKRTQVAFDIFDDDSNGVIDRVRQRGLAG